MLRVTREMNTEIPVDLRIGVWQYTGPAATKSNHVGDDKSGASRVKPQRIPQGPDRET
jgi:hypothetical protein